MKSAASLSLILVTLACNTPPILVADGASGGDETTGSSSTGTTTGSSTGGSSTGEGTTGSSTTGSFTGSNSTSGSSAGSTSGGSSTGGSTTGSGSSTSGGSSTGGSSAGGSSTGESSIGGSSTGGSSAGGSTGGTGGLVVLVSSGEPEDIAVNAGAAYWRDGDSSAGMEGDVLDVPLEGGSISTFFDGYGTGYVWWTGGLAVDATNVYWVACNTNQTSNLLLQAPVAGGSPVTLASPASCVEAGVAVDAQNVYWADNDSDGWSVKKVQIGGGAVTTLASGQSGSLGPLATNGTTLAWIANPASIVILPTVGGTPTTLATGESPYGIAIDANNVYWSDYGDYDASNTAGFVMEVPLTGGTATTLASGLAYPAAIAVDASNVYVSGGGGISTLGWFDPFVISLPLSGGSRTTLSSTTGSAEPKGIAFDSTSLYWSNYWSAPDAAGPQILKLTPK